MHGPSLLALIEELPIEAPWVSALAIGRDEREGMERSPHGDV